MKPDQGLELSSNGIYNILFTWWVIAMAMVVSRW